MPRSPLPAIATIVGVIVLLVGVVPNWWFSAEAARREIDADMRKYYDDDELRDMRRKRTEISYGLRELEVCERGRCQSLNYSFILDMQAEQRRDRRDRDRDWDDDREEEEFKNIKGFMWVGRFVFWGSVLVTIVTGLGLLLWLLRQRLKLSIGLVGAVLAGGVIVMALVTLGFRPEVPKMEKAGLSAGLPLTLLGAIGCIVGNVLLMKAERSYPLMGAHAAPYGAGPGYPPGGYPHAGYPMQPPHAGYPMQQPPHAGYPPHQAPVAGYPAQQPPPDPPPPQAIPACPRCSAPAQFVTEYQRYYCTQCRAYL
jgi:hypothetical protein